jgi:hypothetical protein
MNIINNEKRNYIMKIEKVNNEDIPTSMNMPKDTSLSEASKHIRKEIDDWIKEGNEKVIISPVSTNLSEKK